MSDRPSSSRIISEDQALEELALLNQLKSRVTGTAEQEILIKHIEQQLTVAKLDVHSDQLPFTMWQPVGEAMPSSLHVDKRPLSISSIVPYSGTTGSGGVGGELVLLRGPAPLWRRAEGKIAVLEVNNFVFPLSAIVDTWPGGEPWADMRNPLIPATLSGLGLSRAKKAGVKAVIFVWRGISDENAQGQYLPFTLDYQDIPAVFVSGDAGSATLAGAAKKSEATLRLGYHLVYGACTRTIWTMIEGTELPDETVFVVTHTDGVNAVEENGHIAAVAMARNAALNPPERTTVFVFTSGHMRIPAVTPQGQATQRFLTDHPELWAGGPGQRRAVAGLAVEHLGAREFIDRPDTNEFRPSGHIEPELVYATTPQLAKLVQSEWKPDPRFPIRISKPSPLVHFGEGEPLLHCGIPAISLVTAPVYLLAERSSNEELVDVSALLRQVDNFERLYRSISAAHATDFGQVNKPLLRQKLGGTISLVKALALYKAKRVSSRQ